MGQACSISDLLLMETQVKYIHTRYVYVHTRLDWFKIYVWRIYTEGTSYVITYGLETPEQLMFAKNMQSLHRASHLKFCNMWYNERIGEQGSRAELWQYFFNKSCSE